MDRQIDTLIATDVAGAGSTGSNTSPHVVNFDIPEAAEAYVHRIGRTGRAGREGKAILFVEPGKVRRLRDIRAPHQAAHQASRSLPSVQDLLKKKNERLAQSIGEVIAAGGLDYPTIDALIGKFELRDIAAAALKLAGGTRVPAPAVVGTQVSVVPLLPKRRGKSPPWPNCMSAWAARPA